MSYNLLIYRAGEGQELAPLGNLTSVTAALNKALPGLEWLTPSECQLTTEDGLTITLTVEGDEVRDCYTTGGFHRLKDLAVLCKKNGWRLADAQEGEDLDLDNPSNLPSSGDDG